MSEPQVHPHEAAPSADAARICVNFTLRKALRMVSQVYDRYLQPSGLKATQFSLLVTLERTGAITVTRLAERMAMERTTLTRNLRPLERKGLVRIMPGKDRRTRGIAITEAGSRVVEQTMPLWEEAQARVVNELGPERWAALQGELETLKRIADDLH